MCPKHSSLTNEQQQENERITNIRLNLLNTLIIVIGFTFTGYSNLSGFIKEFWGMLIIGFFIFVFLIYSVIIRNRQWKYLDVLYVFACIQFIYIILIFFYGNKILKNPEITLLPLALAYLIVLTLAFSDSDVLIKTIIILSSIALIILLILMYAQSIIIHTEAATYQSNNTYNFTETVKQVFPFTIFCFSPSINENTNQYRQNIFQENIIKVRSEPYNASEHPEMWF